MNKTLIKKFFDSIIWLMIIIFVLDFATKWIVQLNLKDDIILIPGFLKITLTHNLGASFGMGNGGEPFMRALWITISVVMSAGLIFYYIKSFKKNSKLYNIAFALMIAGALGNAVDRIFYWEALVGFDGVIDWISFTFGSYNFPVFNIADSSLVIGVILLLVLLIIEMVKDAIKKNKDGAYSLPPEQYEKKLKKEAEALEKENNEANNSK